MPLTHRDLEAIRAIVREEIDRHRPASPAPSPSASAPDSSTSGDVRRELARATLARLRGEPGAIERELRADARYRLHADDTSWIAAARRLRKDTSDRPVTFDEMLAYARERHARGVRNTASRVRNRKAREAAARQAGKADEARK